MSPSLFLSFPPSILSPPCLLADSWLLDEDDEGTNPQRLGTVTRTDERLIQHHMPLYYHPQPQSPSTPSFSSDDDTPWYEDSNPNVTTGLWSGGALPNGKQPYTIDNSRSPTHYQPYPGYDTAGATPRFNSAEQHSMAQQRLDRYFSQSSTLDEDSSSLQSYDSSGIGVFAAPSHPPSHYSQSKQRHRRMSSPPGQYTTDQLRVPSQAKMYMYSDSERSSLTVSAGFLLYDPYPLLAFFLLRNHCLFLLAQRVQ